MGRQLQEDGRLTMMVPLLCAGWTCEVRGEWVCGPGSLEVGALGSGPPAVVSRVGVWARVEQEAACLGGVPGAGF